MKPTATARGGPGRLVLGTMAPTVGSLFDAFAAAGGSMLDTAYVYRDGAAERDVGTWLQTSGARGDVVIVSKGAHPPLCRPDVIAPQLSESLDRLGTAYVDLYLPHRDDLGIPVDEWVDALVHEVRAGRALAYGFSNWTLARVAAARDYATRCGLPAPTAVSNHLSLARMVRPRWPGCVSSGDPASRLRVQEMGLTLLAWSSLAGGFFRGDADMGDAELGCWMRSDNLERRRRCRELADRLGVTSVEVALAYVLALDPPVYALVGPASPAELNSCLRAANLVELDAQLVAWLDLAQPGEQRLPPSLDR